MKIIRYNLFETNSSSTTTLIIKTISDENPLFSGGVLNLSALNEYKISTEYSDAFLANTKELKLALILSFFNPTTYHDYHNLDGFPEEKIIEVFDKLKRNYNIVNVIGEFVTHIDSHQLTPDIDKLIELIENPNKILKYEHESTY